MSNGDHRERIMKLQDSLRLVPKHRTDVGKRRISINKDLNHAQLTASGTDSNIRGSQALSAKSALFRSGHLSPKT